MFWGFSWAPHLFIYDLFNDALNSSDIWRRIVGWLVNNEIERMWKEAAMA
jgi:hypothetical protein